MADAPKNFRLVNVGRSKFCGDVLVRNPEALMRAVSRHLMSSDVSIDEDGTVLAGFRPVGRIEPLNDLAAQMLKNWCSDG